MKKLGTAITAALMLFVLLVGVLPGQAQEYLLGVGDVLRISVWGHAELTTEVAVRPDGYLTFPLVGDHMAVGKSARQLSQELEAILADYVVNPRVTVIVSQFRSLQVQVLGEVKSSGYYQLRAGARLMDILALAGGPTQAADLQQISITRYYLDNSGVERTEVLRVNVDQFLANGDLTNNPLMESGDLVFVPSTGKATIFGEVRQPTSYDLRPDLNILDLLALAGGALESADLERVVVTVQTENGPQEKRVNVQAMLAGRKKPLAIGSNDVVFVPKKQQVMVFGAVQRPGVYELRREDTFLIDILAQAGGVLPSGDASAISISRRVGEQQQVIPVDASPGLTGKEGGDNPRLMADDLIFVPEGYQNALVLGQVRSPGSYQVREQTRILDLLAQAGGTVERAGDELFLTRDGETKKIELRALERLGLQNERVRPGDVLYIPEGRNQVLVLGEVRSPGYYQFRAGDRLLDAIALAGGLTADALEEGVSLTRRSEEEAEVIHIDLGELMENRYLADNMTLQGGDVIIVPKADRGIIVLGEVRAPGYYTFRSDQGLLDAIMLAGGFTDFAQEDQVSLTRRTEEGTEVTLIDFTELMDKRYLEGDLALQDGDIIVVPKSDRSVLVLGEVRSPGYYVFNKGQRMLDMIAAAGGFTEDAEPGKVVVSRQLEEGVVSDALNLDLAQTEAVNPELQGGEIIMVPKSSRMVLVFGEVTRAGAYTLPPAGRLLDILALAGGLKSNLGSEQVVVTRQTGAGEQIWEVAYGDLMAAQSEYNLPLLGGDVVYVPASKQQILVLGQVRNPGVYNLPVGARVMDAIALAGGPLERAALENVGIYRDGSVEEGEMVAMGHDKVLFTGDVAENPLLQGGDIIYVPETKRLDWTKIFGFLGGIKTFQDIIRGLYL